MTAGLETFAKVRALHDRAGTPGEKAAAAGRMEALARSAGMTVAEAVSRLDAASARPRADVDWAAFTDTFWRAEAAGRAADAPEAPSRRQGLPIYDPGKVECWRDVAWHCLQLDWTVPKKHGGRFLTKDERARLKAVAQYGPVTNATADWIEIVLTRCEAARVAWRDRSGLFQAGARPGRQPGESDVEWAARMVAAAKGRGPSKLDTPEPPPRSQGPAQAFAESFADFMNRPEFVDERNEREARRRVEAAAIVERYGSEDALFADTPMEAALRAACEPLLGRGETWRTIHRLDGWGALDSRAKMPASVRAAVSRAWPMPETVAAAWAEFEATDRLTDERYTVDSYCDPHLFVQARQHLIEEALNTLPARTIHDLRARLNWMDHLANDEVAPDPKDDRIRLATLRADIDRMGERVPGQDPAPVHSGQDADGYQLEPQPVSHARAEYPRRPTRAERHAAIRDLLAAGHTDREVARRLSISPTTVGAVRRAAEKDRTP